MEREAAVEEARVRRAVERSLGVAVEAVEPLAGGLGARRFFRLRTRGAPASLVARVEAPERAAYRPAGVAPEPPLEPLRAFLAAQGLPVPARLGGDAAAGIELLEDLGDTHLARAVAQAPDRERQALYREAVDLVPRLQRLSDPGGLPAFERRLDAALLAFKADLFVAHGLPAALGRDASPAEAAAVRGAFLWIAGELEAAPLRLAHRDLQSHNLMVRTGASAGRRLVMIDLQGAFLAPPEYDLVALLRDSYVELPDAEVRALCEDVRPRLPDAPDPESFGLRFDLLTLTRKAKDFARFCQAARAGDRRYLRHLPATARALRGAAARRRALRPELTRLAELIARLPEAACAR